MATTSVKASVLHGVKDLRVEDRTLPPLPADHVRVAVKATTLCGSDLHYYNHFRNGDILVREPLTLGHESAGVVTAVGSAVPSSSLAVGDRVALEVGVPCGECPLCRSSSSTQSRYNICRAMQFRSSARNFPHAQGTLQTEIAHPAAWCHKLPASVPLHLGALAEPLSVAMHALDRAQLPSSSSSSPAATVLILGAGAVGLLCAAVCKVAGAGAVVIADIQEERVGFATRHGFADAGFVVPARRPETVEAKLEFAREVAGMAAGVEVGGEAVGEVSRTFECTGVEICLQTAIYATQPGGRVMLIGMGTPIQTLPISAAALREVDLVGSFRYAHTYPRVLDLLASGDPRLPPLGELCTQRYRGLEAVPEAFGMAGRVKDDEGRLVLKVVVEM